MADIKFMDISQNDNPATTDSILVGNKDNGLKRTTLGKLGEMFAVHGLFHFESVFQVLKPNTLNYSITAPDVEGYKFAFWIGVQTVGCVLGCYVENATSNNATIWTVDEFGDNMTAVSNGQSGVKAVAVYVKNEVA